MYPPDPPTVDEIVAVMRQTPADRHGLRLRALIVVMWRGGLRIPGSLPDWRHCRSGEQPAKVAGGVRFRPEQASRRLVSFGCLPTHQAHRACRTCVPCPPRQGGRVRVAAECPRPRKSRSARCGVSTDQRFSSACDREPRADTALQTRTWRRAGRLLSPVASCAFDSPCVGGCHGSTESDAVHLHLRPAAGGERTGGSS